MHARPVECETLKCENPRHLGVDPVNGTLYGHIALYPAHGSCLVMPTDESERQIVWLYPKYGHSYTLNMAIVIVMRVNIDPKRTVFGPPIRCHYGHV